MYYLYDYYEGGKTLIAKSDDWFEIHEERKKYLEETDYECELEVVSIDEDQ